MISSNTRAARSRRSSPQTAPQIRDPAETPRAGNTDGQRSLLGWLEPPLQMKPSYQEAGLVRHGVVENMAPLGTLPKTATVKKPSSSSAAPPQSIIPPSVTSPAAASTPAQEHPPIRKIILKRPVVTNSSPSNSSHLTPPSTLPGDAEDSSTPSASAQPTALANMGSNRRSLSARDRERRDRDEDEDWEPNARSSNSHKASKTRRSLPRASATRFGTRSAQQESPPTLSPPVDEELKAQAGKVAEEAVDEALKHFRYPTAWALKTLYDENCDDAGFLQMLVAVYIQTADEKTLDDFARLVHEKKKEGKKDNKGCYYFVHPSTNSRFTPHKPKPAPYGKLVRLDISKYVKIHGSDALPNPRPSKRQKSSHEPSPTPARRSASAAKMSSNTNGVNGNSSARKRTRADEGDDTPARKRTRANSADSESSTSSLSSARSVTPPEAAGRRVDDEYDNDAGSPADSAPQAANGSGGAGESSFARGAAESHAPTAPQPIAAQRRSNNVPAAAPAAKRNGNVSPTRETLITHTQNLSSPTPAGPRVETRTRASASGGAAAPAPAALSSSMPALVDAPLFPNLSSRTSTHNNRQQRQQQIPELEEIPVFPSRLGKVDESDPTYQLKQKARAITNEAQPQYDSFQRHHDVAVPPRGGAGAGLAERELEHQLERLVASFHGLRPRSNVAGTSITGTHGSRARTTRSNQRRNQDDADDQPSPTTLLFPPSGVESAEQSRAPTPGLARTTKRTRTGLRVKSSPMKKRAGPSAGIPRASGERSSPGVNGAAGKEDDNDDYCASCGGNGDLVCCDGCTRSFHFKCVDPPMDEDQGSLPKEWFCNICQSSKRPGDFPERDGSFALLLERLDRKNPSAYRLPGDVREYFDGVKTGPDGEYEELVAAAKTSRKRKHEEQDAPDFFKLRDAEGNTVICHNCELSSSENRAIIPCSACGLYWHLDCLDPPLANPPVLRTWKCPAHVDDILTKLPGALAPAHKFRKIKGAPVIRPAFSTGNVNNGFIDVVLAEDESGWRDVETFGKVYRLHERGIKLDFFERLRRNLPREIAAREKQINGDSAPAITPDPTTAMAAELENQADHESTLASELESSFASPTLRTLDEQQVALSLTQLAEPNDSTKMLVDALLAQADPTAMAYMGRGNAVNLRDGNLTGIDQQALRAMLAEAELLGARIKARIEESLKEAEVDKPATPQLFPSTPQNSAPLESTPVAQEPHLGDERIRSPEQVLSIKRDLPSPASTNDAAAVEPAKNDAEAVTEVSNNAESAEPPTPEKTQIEPHVESPVENHIEPLVEHPTEPLVEHPVEPPVEHPVEPLVEHRVEPLVEHHVEPPIAHHVEPPVEHHVRPPIAHQVEPQVEHQVEPQVEHHVEREAAHHVEPTQVRHHVEPQIASAMDPEVKLEQESEQGSPNVVPPPAVEKAEPVDSAMDLD